MYKKRNNRNITKSYLQGAAYRYLERYATTEANLFFILKRKTDRILSQNDQEDFNISEIEAWINEVVIECVKHGLVNDRLYAESKMNSYSLSGNSLANIKNKLRSKGVPQDIINDVINKAISNTPDINFKSAIKYAKKRRFGPFRIRELNETTFDKELASMARAGYSYSESIKILKGKLEDLEDVLYGN